MTGPVLTQAEARARAGLVRVSGYVVDLDVTLGAEYFRSTTTIHFDSRHVGEDTFVDLTDAEDVSVEWNGRPMSPGDVCRGNRLSLPDLRAHNTLLVRARLPYSAAVQGLHRSVDPSDGATYLYSHCEPAHASRVYACFDQPDLKAPWQLNVIAPPDFTVVSNSPVVDVTVATTAGQPARRWRFAETPPLATYLTAVVAGPFALWHDEHTVRHRGIDTAVPLTIGCRRSLAAHMDVAELFDITRRGLDHFVEQFDSPYPFAKYAQMMVPDFGGAMEHPGCVTFADRTFVFRGAETRAERDALAETMLHEMAHMWFGNLVTPTWWDDLWLKESFATNAAADAFARLRDTDDTAAVGRQSRAVARDELPTTHPVVTPVPHVDAAFGAFDEIAYEKGSAVLRQLQMLLGEDVFLAGIRGLLRRYAWGNMTTDDFLAGLGTVSGQDLGGWAERWLHTAGANTLRAEVTSDRHGTVTSVDLLQLASNSGPLLRDHRLAIGFYRRGHDGAFRRTERVEVHVEGARTRVPALVGVPGPDIVLLDDGAQAFAKIRLDSSSIAAIRDHLGEVADPVARVQLWSQAWASCRDGLLAARDYVSMTVLALARAQHTDNLDFVAAALDNCHVAIDLYADSRWRSIARGMLAELARSRIGSGNGDAAFWLREYARSAADGSHLDELATLVAGSASIDGLEMTADLRWHVVIALAAANRFDADDIDRVHEADRTTAGLRRAATAHAARPTSEAKAEAWRGLTSGTLSESVLIGVAKGFAYPGQAEVRAPYASLYYESATEFAARSERQATGLLAKLFPADDVSREGVRRADAFLARPVVPSVAARAVANGRDGIVRALRARSCDRRAAGDVR
ncbi:aminopeptidase N [Streptomyces sp. MI02-7b]|uniref:aminopeptidase N n=1 Tax=Streptomyces sp. MI02-7b TaxID=462941 RepID=UPI0029A7DE07|nr:aminopeptidase N [Streptomyces sp. MI02-7b]MDX3078365.1 aminopeptidase N [Streptomyces sp. MI02-7b]